MVAHTAFLVTARRLAEGTVAPIRQRRCEGCRLQLDPVEISRIRSAAPDLVIRHEECRRILVRTTDSGL